MGFTDKELGMDRKITRRDFMQGAAMTIGAAAASHKSLLAQTGAAGEAQNGAGYDPPALHGMRGSHEGSYQVAHSLRDGSFWHSAGAPMETGESYDLIVVGGGISGLSSARFFREAAGKNARVLILENHDDFGGHAKRNEFEVNGKFMLGYGGTYAIESPAPYSAVAKRVIGELGIDVPSYSKHANDQLYGQLGLKQKIFFDKETFGADRLAISPYSRWGGALPGDAARRWQEFAAQSPMTDQAKADLKRLYELDSDPYPSLSSEVKKAKLARMSYASYLNYVVKVDPQVVALLNAHPQPLYGLGIDAVSAQDAWGLGLPGFNGLKLTPEYGPGMGRDARHNDEAEAYFFHFPDGNASIARMLVRGLVPNAIGGSTAEDIVSQQVRYDQLDQPANPTRIRLNSTVVRVKHLGEVETAQEVEISYVQQGKLYTVKAAHCVLACWHPVIPYLTNEISAHQRDALRLAEKVPIVYTNVAIQNWTSFAKLQAASIYSPGCYFSEASLDHRVSIGKYECTTKPDEPIVLTMHRYPCQPGLSGREQHRAGRADLYATSFETFERNIREQLTRSVGAGGFDSAKDIAAITVNRWPHGYAYQYNSLWDPFWLAGTEAPCVIARQSYGRVAIANADADAYAYTDCAIDQAYRAVTELKVGKVAVS
ncbi:spermidine dehydrogenase [Silvibacterium bohemicum]|uniref:Spermidine dehydrogenase n=1 Tax=Silvibacterium bohemicum TaxID=1577686 RepID=A0A841K0S0_9BACT|nr:NAD(P)/FAD-dependent oxidoreductase [Silvibacterium bohemicum]MBB6144801.1 spermidine dehydrogenase [Silvibacterium bohemicum]